MRNTVFGLGLSASALVLAGCSGATGDDLGATADAVRGSTIESVALDNVGKGACSTNSKGSKDYDSSCTGNDHHPEYWCADFARWVWDVAGAEDTGQLDAAAGSFYTYGENHHTLHSSPAVGDAVVFNYRGDGVADHVAIVTKVESNGDIETVSGDWGGENGTEAHFASTSHVVLNAPAYNHTIGSVPGIMGMKISGFISPVGLTGASSTAKGCYSDTLDKEMPANACVQSKYDRLWYQCDNGSWVDRWTDPTACDGVHPL